MFDTFVFRLNRVQEKYPMLVNMIRTEHGKEWSSTKSTKLAKKMELRTWLHTYKDEISIPLRYSDKRNIPSSNHDIPFTADWVADYIEANVSIPKMLYGNNVCELVLPPGHRQFSVNHTSPFADSQIDYAFDCLKTTVVKVLTSIAHGNYIALDMSDIEICRLDICVNQHFDSKDEALRYLFHQKQIHKKHNRLGGASNSAEWKTSITFKTSRYYAKIYHKGTEFRNLQQGKIIELRKRKDKNENSKLALAEMHLNDLADYSDKILRYELEFKKQYLNYLWNYKVNKQWSPEWKACVRLFNFFERNPDFKESVFNYEVRYIDFEGKETKEKLLFYSNIKFYHKRWNGDISKHEYEPFTRKELNRLTELRKIGVADRRQFKDWMKYMNSELTKSRSFSIALPLDAIDTTRKKNVIGGKEKMISPFVETPKEARFTKSLLIEMLNSFGEFFINFQIRTKNPKYVFQDQIDKYEEHQQSLRKIAGTYDPGQLVVPSRTRRTLLQFYAVHGKYTMKDLVPKEFSRPTYYRIKKLFSEITGTTENIAYAHFSNGIERDIHQIWNKLYVDINYSFLTKFYNSVGDTIGIRNMPS